MRREGLGGKSFVRVPVMTLGGGTSRVLSIPPAPERQNDDGTLVKGAIVVLAFFGDKSAVCLGTITDDEANAGFLTEPGEEREDNADVGPDTDINTAAIVWEGAKVSGRDGDLAFRPAPGRVASVETSGGGAMRVSSGGEADDWAVLARSLVSELAVLYAKVNSQDRQIAELTLTLTAATLAMSAPKPPPPTPYAASSVEPFAAEDVGARVLRLSGEIAR
ncbi:MAG TPA: hypothetical protein PK095_00750 [Myxococcota bacterium]|nr:hypothetical protein [Myxococcota bacterium]